MIITQRDPHPGRCRNLRMSTDAYGYPNHVRCVENAGHDSRCRFPKPPARRTPVVYSAASNAPQPWTPPAKDDENYE